MAKEVLQRKNSEIIKLKAENGDLWFSNNLLNTDFLNMSKELKDVKSRLGAYYFLFNVMDYLLEEKEDIRMEELICNLQEQLPDNPGWIKEFPCT